MRRKKHIGMITKIFICIFAVYAAVTLVRLQIQMNAKQDEIQNLTDKIQSQKLKNEEMKDALGDQQNDDYISKVAREKLGYVSPGEKIFVDSSSK